MPELSLGDIDQISRDISREDITFSHLLDDLIDHVCCDVENEMAKGLTFREAYQMVKQKIGPRRFREIQEETLYAIDAKYRKMKTTMKISGIAGTVMFGIAAMFKIQHWPGAGVLMTLGAFTLAFIFMPSALGVLWKETKNKKKIFLFIASFLTGFCFIAGTLFKVQHWPFAGLLLTICGISGILLFIPALFFNRLNDPENKSKRSAYILGSIGAMLFVAGLLFKIQHWPFATVQMVLGLILLVITALPLYTWFTWKDTDHISPKFIFMIVGSLLIIMPGALLNLNLQRSYQDYYYPNNLSQNEMYNLLYRTNSSFINSYRDSSCFKQMESLHSGTIALLEVVTGIQMKMVQQSESNFGKPQTLGSQIKQTDNGSEIVYTEISHPMDPFTSKDFLMKGCSSREELGSSMMEYRKLIAGLVPEGGHSKLENLLDPDTFLPVLNPELTEFSLMSALHSLQVMKNGILTVESSVLKEIASNR